jgi:PhnB protein
MLRNLNIPENYQTVMPYLIIKEASKFIEFMQKAFDAKETHKTMRDEQTIMHGEIMIGESTIMFADSTEKFSVNNAGLFMYVDDADDTYKKAITEGAISQTEVTDQSYGRSGGIKDPFGNVWWITSINKN